MYDFNYNHEESNARTLALQYESMVANGQVIFFDQEAFQDLIDYYEDQLCFKEALEVIEYALQQHTFSAIFYIRKAQLLLEEDRLVEASKAIALAKLYEPSNIDIFLTESEIFHQEGNFTKALELLETALIYADSSDNEDIYLLEAAVHESNEDYLSAFQALGKVLKVNSFNEIAYSRLWLCIELIGNYEESIELHQKILADAPYAYWAWYNLGHAYNSIELYEKAIDAYDYAIIINEKFEFAYRDIIACLFRVELYNVALKYVQAYKQFFEIDADLLLWEGECYEYTGKYSMARNLYQQAIRRDTLDGRLHYRIGVTYASENKWRKALQAFQTAFNQDKENEEYCIALAEIHNQLDDVQKAHTFFQRATELSPELSITWMSYLEFLIDEEDYDLAFEVLVEAEICSLNDQYELVKLALLWLSGRLKEGRVLLIQVLEKQKKLIDLVFKIAPDLMENEYFMVVVGSYM